MIFQLGEKKRKLSKKKYDEKKKNVIYVFNFSSNFFGHRKIKNVKKPIKKM